MDFKHLPNITLLGVGLVLAFLAFHTLKAIATWRRRVALKRQHGVLPAHVFQPWWDPFGLELFFDAMKCLREHRLLERAQHRLTNMGVNTAQVTILGKHIHQTIEPENLKTIQATEFKKWGLGERRKYGFMPLLGEGIFTTDGAKWQHSREMLRPNFVRSQVGDLATFEVHISHLIDAIPKDGSTVDLGPLFFSLTIDSATEFLFGTSTNSLLNKNADGFADAFTFSQEYIANGARWGIWSRLFPANQRFVKDRDFVWQLIDSYVDQGLSKHAQGEKINPSSDRYVFIDELVRQTTDKVKIRSELLNILLAGRDTTASLLTNVWYLLSHHPDVWSKLQADIARLGSEPPTFESLKDLKYLRAVLNETLRLYPVVPVNSREAQEDTILPVGGGPDGRAPIFIPKGGVVSWTLYAMHRRKDYYGEDAEEFRPERWLDDPVTGKKGLRPGWEYLPFNGGARICLGQQFALTEASYTTVRLCQMFSGIEKRDEEGWRESLTLTCVNLGGAKVGLRLRE